MLNIKFFTAIVMLNCLTLSMFGQGDGLLVKNGQRVFPIGWYELPEDNTSLKEMADAGINVVRCWSQKDLDHVQSFGMQGWIRLPLENGATTDFKKQVQSIMNNPALAVWEGPDELVWNFTGGSALYTTLKVYKTRTAWKDQSPEAVQYARKKSQEIFHNMKEAISYLRSVDPYNRQIWINEAANSDVSYVRQYLDLIDITGCDKYPVTTKRDSAKLRSDIAQIGSVTERWKEIAEGKPVWMVLQACSRYEKYTKENTAYQAFDESRFMTYDAIVHGARGILYWNAQFLQSEDCRQSLYALTSELNALQPFLIAPEQKQIKASVIKDRPSEMDHVVCMARQFGREWMIVLVNDDDTSHLGVTVNGLTHLDGIKLYELYGDEEATIKKEEFTTRMKPFEVKVFTTGRKWETIRVKGRDYQGT